MVYQGRIVLRDICTISQGRCAAFCPRISVDLENLSQEIFRAPYAWDELGTVKKVFMARSPDAIVRAKAQDAGVVTTLTVFAIEQGFIDSAVLTRFEDKSLPKGVITSNKHEVLECAGSSYIAAPTIEAFNQVVQDNGYKNIGVIGTPCQVLALARMRSAPPEMCKNMDKLKLIVGLFCTWALSYIDFAQFLEKEVPDHIVKYDVPPHPANVLLAYTKTERIDIPLEKVLPFVKPACQMCPDLTAEFADISVGSGRREVLDWNTVIVRTERAMRLINAAIEKGVIETRDIPEENLSRLKAASGNKKKRALKNIIQKTGSPDNLLYLKTRAEMIKPFLEG
jgi:coenzyme F420 hydrogenase subunit beta